MLDQACPCGTKKKYADCCHQYISGTAVPADPETLMRSRYSAFFHSETAYLLKTWDPETAPDDLGADEPTNWIGLEIIDSDVDEEEGEGEVEFKAKLIYDDKLETLHERSLFLKLDGQWVYHSGEFLNEGGNVQKIKKSQPCPCGSSKLFKNCHGTA